MSHTQLSRPDLLSLREYDIHRDGDDALPLGKPNTQVPYTGGKRIALDDTLAKDRAMYHVRAHAAEYQPWLVEGMEAMRLARIPDGKWDWDCKYCHTSVITDVDDTTCPNCFLT